MEGKSKKKQPVGAGVYDRPALALGFRTRSSTINRSKLKSGGPEGPPLVSMVSA